MDEKKPDSQQENTGPETRKFKAEVKQILDIVIHSLYTHREIFIRELVSNASDALEKMRHEALIQKNYLDKDAPHEIRIETDKDAHTLTVTDTGVGMTHDELGANLGTIARSGTKEFLESIENREQITPELIGKFGVGFYSAFMAGERVTVRTRSFRTNASGYEWVSDGAGEYTITGVENLPRGTSVIVKLKEDAREYEDAGLVKNIIRKYSNFVSFPILVNGERVNTIQAIWLKSSSEVSDSEYKEFFKFISNTEDEPLYRLHLTSDAPLQLSAILYVPSANMERFGFFRLKPMINLYSRKILIVQHAEELVPEYMRFITGVVDSADLALNISRETLQDNLVFRKLKKFLDRRIIRFLEEEAKKDPKKYLAFWESFGMFIKEGAVSDYENRTELSGLLRFRSGTAQETFVSLDDYIGRLKEGQNAIYYLNGRTVQEIERGPYLSAFMKRGIEVLYLHDPIDDFVMTSLGQYKGKRLISADSADIELPPAPEEEKKEQPALSSEDARGLLSWMKDTLGDAASEVRESKRSMDRPAIVVNPEEGMTASMRRILKAAGRDAGMEKAPILEINTGHPLIHTLKKLREGKTDKGFLQACVRQIFDNALAEAGLLEDPSIMVDRVYTLMERALKAEEEREG
ncbi:MAG: molecular chaperone HtpG [Candidatus Latescibacter sp.]|nr:molecular chaperone HtpG [Candidatus Latescibacter sp.]